jgi:hypothetical protein
MSYKVNSAEELDKLSDLYDEIRFKQLTSPASLKTELSLFKDLGRTKWADYEKNGNNYSTSPLSASAYADNPALIDACLEAGININSTNGNNGYTSLWISIHYSSLKSIRHLIINGAKVTDANISQARKKGGESEKTFNAVVGDLAKAKELYTLIKEKKLTSPALLKEELAKFSDLKSDLWLKLTSPLKASVVVDNPAFIDECLAAGINIESTDDGKTSLRYSIQNSKLKSIRHLICRGANVTDANISQACEKNGNVEETFLASIEEQKGQLQEYVKSKAKREMTFSEFEEMLEVSIPYTSAWINFGFEVGDFQSINSVLDATKWALQSRINDELTVWRLFALAMSFRCEESTKTLLARGLTYKTQKTKEQNKAYLKALQYLKEVSQYLVARKTKEIVVKHVLGWR